MRLPQFRSPQVFPAPKIEIWAEEKKSGSSSFLISLTAAQIAWRYGIALLFNLSAPLLPCVLGCAAFFATRTILWFKGASPSPLPQMPFIWILMAVACSSFTLLGSALACLSAAVYCGLQGPQIRSHTLDFGLARI